MAKTMIRNVSTAAITLPAPYIGIIPAGVAVVVDDPPSVVQAALFVVPETQHLLTLDEVSDANPTTVPVSRTAAADTIATQTFAALTTPLNLNGQRAINAGDPVGLQDLVTLDYFNTHGSGGGSGVTYAELGEVDAPGGPYPGIPALTPVAVVGGTVVIANAQLPATVPCVGIYTGTTTNRIRTSGLIEGFTGLPANAPLYLALGGGLAAAPPIGAGQVSQPVGHSVGTTAVFVAITDPTYL